MICLGLMPGSRRSEIKHHLLTQIAAARQVVQKHAQVQVALLVAPGLPVEWLRTQLPELKFQLTILQTSPFEMIQMADVILCASGTATLMVGLMEKPMVIMYRMTAFTAMMAKLLVRKTRFFGMVNLISGERVVPELFQEQATPEKLAHEIEAILTKADYREVMIQKLRALKDKLGSHGATERVADVLRGYLQ
jgi:lipid-A-disaccharide synthase